MGGGQRRRRDGGLLRYTGILSIFFPDLKNTQHMSDISNAI